MSRKIKKHLLIADVSSYQETINWKLLKGSVDGVIIRVGFVDNYWGGNINKTDPMFKINQLGARSNGFRIGYYYYAFADESPLLEASRFMKGIGKLQKNESIWLDIEERSSEFNKQWIASFIDSVEAVSGLTCHIYTDFKWINENKWITEFINNKRQFWIADYSIFNRNKIQSTALGNIIMHQYSCRGRLPGIKLTVDLNRFYGDEKDWNKLAQQN